MTDTTNHATMTREEAAAKLVAMMSTDMSLHLTMRRSDAKSAAIDALTDRAVGLILQVDALTRELEETRRDWAFNIGLAEGAVKEQQATISAQSERIKALEEESARMVKLLIQVREEIIKDDPQEAYHLVYMFAKSIASDPYKPWTELEARAALAPKEAQG